jgi:hypothetical protein
MKFLKLILLSLLLLIGGCNCEAWNYRHDTGCIIRVEPATETSMGYTILEGSDGVRFSRMKVWGEPGETVRIRR